LTASEAVRPSKEEAFDMKRRVCLFLFLSISYLVLAAPLPQLQVTDLDGTPVTLPKSNDAVTLLVVGFSRKAGNQVAALADRLDDELGAGLGYEIDRVAILQEVPKLFRPLALAGIKDGVPVAIRGRFFTTVRDLETWKAVVGFQARDVAYVVLVNRMGEIRKTFAGVYDRRLFENVVAAARNLGVGF
jgi:hypothetical protein